MGKGRALQASFEAQWLLSPQEWKLYANPSAGVMELQWFHSAADELRNYEGLWVGIKRTRIVASGATLSEVHEQLTELNIPDALIVRVPEDLANDHTLIA